MSTEASADTTTGLNPGSASTNSHVISGPDAQLLNIRIDLLILILFIFLVLCRLPRCLARLSLLREWTSGHFLRSGTFYPQHDTEKILDCPPHVPSLPRLFSPISAFLSRRVSPGYSIGQSLILIIYFGILCFPAFYQTTGPFTDAHRPGWVAVAQMPFLFAFGVKNSILNGLIGMGYEKLNFLHRFLGKVVVLAVNIHSLGYIYKWCFEMQFKEKIAQPVYRWGMIGLICMDGLYLLSIPWIRKRFYRLFLISHILCVLLLLPAMWFHKPALIPWVIACGAIYVLDRACRLAKTRYTVATISAIPSLGMTRLECHSLTTGWRAGQHVRVRVLSSGMGPFGWLEVHPFTIASAPDGHGLVLMCKKAGSWTSKLYDIASHQTHQGHMESGPGANVKLLIEGPYGGPGHTMMASFSAATFICGGSGIALGLAAIEDLISKSAHGECRVRVIELVWFVQDPSCLYPLLPQLVSMLERTTSPLKISVYYTRPCAEKSYNTQYFPSGLHMSAGKPKLHHILETVIAKTLRPSLRGNAHGKLSGMLVGVCGPISLADETSKAVGMIDYSLRNQVGGIEMYQEVFGW